MPRPYRKRKSNAVRYTKKKPKNTKNAIVKLDNRVKGLSKRINTGAITEFRCEFQAPRQSLSARWNRIIVMAPNQLHSSAETAAWKTVFNMDQSPTTLYQKPKAYIKGIKLIQDFRLNDLPLSPSINQPLVLHNYVVRCKQDAGAEWKQATAGEWHANHLKQDVHFAHLGGNSDNNVVTNSRMFFLNKKCFEILAQHHHVFGPYGMYENTGTGTTASPIGTMTNLKRYQKTFVDWLPLNIKLSSAGNQTIFGNERGWTGITYQNVSVRDQVLILNWVSQGDTGTVGSYTLSTAASGLIYGSC